MSQFRSIKNKKMSDDSSCSSNLDTFQMYQDFEIICDDPIPRRDRWDHTRIDWAAHVEKLCHEQRFKREYRMSLEAFNKLVFILSPSLQRNNMYSRSSTPSHLLSLSALASATWQVASCLIFDMFLEFLLQRPTTVLNVSLKALFIVNR